MAALYDHRDEANNRMPVSVGVCPDVRVYETDASIRLRFTIQKINPVKVGAHISWTTTFLSVSERVYVKWRETNKKREREGVRIKGGRWSRRYVTSRRLFYSLTCSDVM